jgi:hypothetical protein
LALAVARVAVAEARFARACVASTVASTCPARTLSPTATRTEVSVPLAVKLADALEADVTLPDADTLDWMVPRVTVAVRELAPAAELDVPYTEIAARVATATTAELSSE